jgi:hypothetical protein
MFFGLDKSPHNVLRYRKNLITMSRMKKIRQIVVNIFICMNFKLNFIIKSYNQ